MSKTASTRPGSVIANQLPSAPLIDPASMPAAALPPSAGSALGVAGAEASGAPTGAAKPVPAVPSEPRSPAPASAFLKAEASSACRRPVAAADFGRSTSGITAYG